jgi:ribose-phosphate pyrophosphokinase
MSRKRPLIFSTESYDYLREAMERERGFEPGCLERKSFPDGERYRRILSDVNDRKVIVVGGTISDTDTLELFDLCCALAKYGAETLRIIIPYYGYSTMERAVKDGEIVTAKTRARLLSAIPLASHGNTAFFLDLHSEGIPHYLEGGITSRHIYAKPVIIEAARKMAAGRPFVLASTDAGRAKWVESLARDMGVPPAFAYKSRIDGSTVESRGVSGPVKDKLVIIYDDMIRTGGSLIEAGKAYKAAGAAEIAVIATHGLFPNNGLDRLKQSGLFTRVVTTDSHPNAVKLAGDFLHVASVASLLATVLKSR